MKVDHMIILREICRALCTANLQVNDIARMYDTSPKRVARIKRRLKKLKLSWEEIEDLGHQKLKDTLYPKRKNRYIRREPNWIEVYELMKNKHQTQIQIWEEYRLVNPDDAYSYAQFTVKFKKFLSTVDVSMRIIHRPGEVIYVDYAGLTISYVESKKEKKAHVFVAVLGASNYTFAFACRDQSTESWIDVHNKMFSFFGGVPEVIVPDYVPRNIIWIMCPPPLCGHRNAPLTNIKGGPRALGHIISYREVNQLIRDLSSFQTAPLRVPTEVAS